jgi:hypothetical protein
VFARRAPHAAVQRKELSAAAPTPATKPAEVTRNKDYTRMAFGGFFPWMLERFCL